MICFYQPKRSYRSFLALVRGIVERVAFISVNLALAYLTTCVLFCLRLLNLHCSGWPVRESITWQICLSKTITWELCEHLSTQTNKIIFRSKRPESSFKSKRTNSSFKSNIDSSLKASEQILNDFIENFWFMINGNAVKIFFSLLFFFSFLDCPSHPGLFSEE